MNGQYLLLLQPIIQIEIIMNHQAGSSDILWITSEFCYYLGLILTLLLIPALTLVLWLLSLIERATPNYWFILIIWGLSALMFAAGVVLKNYIYSNNPNS